MTRKIFGALIAVLLAGSVSVCAETLKGTITDKMCGAKHMMEGKSDADCIAACVKHGSAYAFLEGDKVLDIENQKDKRLASELAKHAGHEVEVAGTRSSDGKSVKIDSIKMPKK